MQLTLVPAHPDLAEWWLLQRQDPATLKYNPLAPSTVESLRERLSKSSSDLSEYATADAFFWGLQQGDERVGHVSLQNINRMMQTVEIGYGVTIEARGRGVGAAGVSLVARNLFAQTPIRKVTAYVHEGNLPSRRLLEKVGFRQEGLLREHYLINGAPVNEAIYGLLKGELA